MVYAADLGSVASGVEVRVLSKAYGATKNAAPEINLKSQSILN